MFFFNDFKSKDCYFITVNRDFCSLRIIVFNGVGFYLFFGLYFIFIIVVWGFLKN